MIYPGSVHNHTDYSNFRLRDSINTYEELIDYALELGQEVIAFTEHETISNAIKIEKYYNKIKKNNPNFKVILGNEIYLCRNGLNSETFVKGQDKFYHFILLAKDAIGHQQIRLLSTRAWLRSFAQGKMIRVPTYYQDLEDIILADPGHVIACTACLGGYLGTSLLKYQENQNEDILDKIYDWIKYIHNIFNNDFYFEMQPSKNKDQIYVNKKIIELSDKFNIPYIITTDSHYKNKEEREIHKAYLNAQEGDREVDEFYATTYLMGTEELESFMENSISQEQIMMAYKTIKEIKDKCQDYSLLKPLKIPSLVWKESKPIQNQEKWVKLIPSLQKFISSNFKGDNKLAELVMNKLEERKDLQTELSYNALENNLETTWTSSEVNKAHWSAYFLNLQKILDVCWEAGSLVGPGRGSGVGFYLLYILDLIQINPLWEKTKTYPWRFLNPERVSVLDIDTDIEGCRRSQVLSKLREVYGENRVANVITFGREKSKLALQTSCRGLGIDNDISLYMASLIPSDRGQTRTLKQCYYGDVENGFEPIPLFVQQMKEYPEVWKIAQKIENLICRVGEHAGGVIFVEDDFTNYTGLMRVPNGDIVTQFDLHDCEDASLIKIDLLSVEGLDKIHNCLDLLVENKLIEPEKTLRETYEKVIGIYNLERESPQMWKMVWEHKIQALFQMEQQSGIHGISLTKPESVEDLAHLNSVIRLMAQEKGQEQPLEKFARFKKNINLWYKEMQDYGLTEQEQEILKPYVADSYGIAESQECFMQLVQIPECGGFNLNFADRLRKAIAKKNPVAYDELTKEYFKIIKEKGLSEKLCNYVWNVLVATSRGYGFNLSHTLAYSLIALQEMNLAYKFPIILWNTACLIADSGGREDVNEENKNNKYGKIAAAIGKMISQGIQIVPVDINKSMYTYVSDIVGNKILCGFRGMLNVGEEVISTIIQNRPYKSVKDFYSKTHLKKQAMLSLIKGGAFDSLEPDRKFVLAWYLWETCDKKSRITLQNMSSLIKKDLLPKEDKYILPRKMYEFNRYLKDKCKKDNFYFLDERATKFLTENNMDDIIENRFGYIVLAEKTWDKYYQNSMDIFRDWMKENQTKILILLNQNIFYNEWIKYNGDKTLSYWEMETLCFYYHNHELAHINKDKYGLVDFDKLPEEPAIERTFKKGEKTIPLFKLSRICGTCIAKDKNKGNVTLLTTTGVITVKFRKEYFAMFDKQVSRKNADGSKTIIEKSWFNRGSKIIVTGMRSGDNFIAKKYASTGGHTLYKIDDIDGNGFVTLKMEREKGELEDEKA